MTYHDSNLSWHYRWTTYDWNWTPGVPWDWIRLSQYRWARAEHIWLLRAEGLTYEECGARLGITRNRAHQLCHRFARRVDRALRRTKFYPQLRGSHGQESSEGGPGISGQSSIND